jgi:hypothetical protein
MKPTPGPWMWDSDQIKTDPLNRVRFRVVARGKTITQCYYSSGDENAEHDARLIAAAPDLLEALEDCLRVVEFLASDSCPTTIQNAKAALAKATGEQQ